MRTAAVLMVSASLVGLIAGCASHNTAAATTTTTVATTTTSTTEPASADLTIVGVRPGVLQAPFYPQVMVTQVTCGASPKGRFVRLDLPAGGPGTPAGSVLTVPTAVIIVPGAALLLDPRDLNRVLYDETMKNITTSTQGAFVLTLQNVARTGVGGLTVQVGAVQVNGDYQCPATDVAYPGT